MSSLGRSLTGSVPSPSGKIRIKSSDLSDSILRIGFSTECKCLIGLISPLCVRWHIDTAKY